MHFVGATLCGRPKIKTNLTKQKITIDKSSKVMYTKDIKKARPQTVVPRITYLIAVILGRGRLLCFYSANCYNDDNSKNGSNQSFAHNCNAYVSIYVS